MRERCKHFTGPVHNKTCKAGVNYRELVGGPDLGWMARMPYFGLMSVSATRLGLSAGGMSRIACLANLMVCETHLSNMNHNRRRSS